MAQKFVGSIEDTSLVRKFTILFILMSVIPVTLLYYFYAQFRQYGNIQITDDSFNLTLIFVAVGSLVGYGAMRSVLQKLINLTEANRKALENVLSPGKIRELSGEKNEIAILAKSFSAITSRLEENVRSLELAKKTLHSVLARVGEGLTSMQNIDSFLSLILESVTSALNARVGVLLFIDEQTHEIWIKSVHGVEYDLSKEIRMPIDESTTLGSVIKTKRPVIIPKIAYDFPNESRNKVLFDTPMICAPLVMHDSVKGIITVSGRKADGNFENDEMNLLFNLASQTAVAVENAQLNADSERTYFETITALAMAVDAKDQYSRGHLDRVAEYCVKIAYALGLSQKDIKTLRDAARLHDVGKIGVPDEVLKKSGALTEQEKEIMNRHPEIGESIIKPIRSLQHLCDIVRHHHEKLDGSGYPDGLKDRQIALLVRITTVADIYDALTTDRPYRKRFTQEEAISELRKMKNLLDQSVVESFVRALAQNNPSVAN